MSKSKNTKHNNRFIDREYMDGDSDNLRRERSNKRDKRLSRAIKTKNIDQLVELEEYNEEQYSYANIYVR
jgi:hypothetical protein